MVAFAVYRTGKCFALSRIGPTSQGKRLGG